MRRTHPALLAEDLASEPAGAGGDEARRRRHEAVVDDRDLHEVLGHGARVDVVAVGLGDAAQEVDRVRVRQVEADDAEDVALGLEDLVVRVAAVRHVEEVLDRGAHDLLVLGRDEEGRDADELELDERHDAHRQEPVDDVDGEEDRLGQEAELGVDLDEPVDEDAAHLPRHLVLRRHVVGLGHGRELRASER